MREDLARDVTALVFGVPVLFELVVGLLVVGALRARNLRTVGPVLAGVRPGRGLRRAAGSAGIVCVFGALLAAGADRRVLEFAGLLLAPALGLVWFGQGFGDALLGEWGVQRGWFSRRYEELEEWRLAGDHLRFRLHGEWTSVPCPPERQAALLQTLGRVNPGAQSAFRD
ncbi:MAG: hypothetical protein IPJ19_20015 [Planctomycetes bacterium]|nr:hypothetical protein [Planctomycetota bacterium]